MENEKCVICHQYKKEENSKNCISCTGVLNHLKENLSNFKETEFGFTPINPIKLYETDMYKKMIKDEYEN